MKGMQTQIYTKIELYSLIYEILEWLQNVVVKQEAVTTFQWSRKVGAIHNYLSISGRSRNQLCIKAVL